VKGKIAKEKGWEAAHQKLIYSGLFAKVDPAGRLAYRHLGKILQDANTVESYKIEEKGFIVCMIQKVCSSLLRLHALSDW
jgi:UV excision repair protein RAD23